MEVSGRTVRPDGDRSRSFLLNTQKGDVQIRGITTGKIKDYGVQDPFNMGACMAPAAADTIYQSLLDFEMKPEDFDQIITGDLGSVGQKLLFELLDENHKDIKKKPYGLWNADF